MEGPVHPLALPAEPPASLPPFAAAFPPSQRDPGPTHRDRGKAGGGAGRGRGRSRRDPRSGPVPKRLLGRICREKENFHEGRALKKLHCIPPKGKGKEKKPGGVGKGPDLAAKTVLKLKKKKPARAQISMIGRGGPEF